MGAAAETARLRPERIPTFHRVSERTLKELEILARLKRRVRNMRLAIKGMERALQKEKAARSDLQRAYDYLAKKREGNTR